MAEEQDNAFTRQLSSHRQSGKQTLWRNDLVIGPEWFAWPTSAAACGRNARRAHLSSSPRTDALLHLLFKVSKMVLYCALHLMQSNRKMVQCQECYFCGATSAAVLGSDIISHNGTTATILYGQKILLSNLYFPFPESIRVLNWNSLQKLHNSHLEWAFYLI